MPKNGPLIPRQSNNGRGTHDRSLCTLTGSELAATLEAEQKRILKNLELPKHSTPINLPDETQRQLEDYEPSCDSLKLKKHLLALHQQSLTIDHHTKALMKIVELCDSDKPEVARRACMTILKLSHLDDAPDLYPYDPDYLLFRRRRRTQKENPQNRPTPAASGGVGPMCVPPATPPKALNIENVDIPFFDFQQFHLKNQISPPNEHRK